MASLADYTRSIYCNMWSYNSNSFYELLCLQKTTWIWYCRIYWRK